MEGWGRRTPRGRAREHGAVVRDRSNLSARIVVTVALPLVAYIAVRWLLPPPVNDVFQAMAGSGTEPTTVDARLFTLPAILAACAVAVVLVPRLWGTVPVAELEHERT